MGDDPRRLCSALMNEVAQLPIVVLDIGLTRPHRLSLEPEHAHVKSNLPLLCQFVGTTRILGQEDADDADSSGEPHGIDKVIHRKIGYLMAVRVAALIAHTFTPSVGTLSARAL